MAKPVYSTGDVPTADEVNNWFVNVQHARVLATQSVTSSTTLQDDDYMVLSVDANAVYLVWCILDYSGAAAGDLKVLFRTPTSGSFYGQGTTLIGAATGQQDNQNMPITGNSSDILGTTGTGRQIAMVMGQLITAGTAGNFKVEWAQNTSNATATQMHTGSWLSLMRVE